MTRQAGILRTTLASTSMQRALRHAGAVPLTRDCEVQWWVTPRRWRVQYHPRDRRNGIMPPVLRSGGVEVYAG